MLRRTQNQSIFHLFPRIDHTDLRMNSMSESWKEKQFLGILNRLNWKNISNWMARFFPALAVISFTVMLFFPIPITSNYLFWIPMEKSNPKNKLCPESMWDSANFQKSWKDTVIFHRGHTQNIIAVLNPCGEKKILISQSITIITALSRRYPIQSI